MVRNETLPRNYGRSDTLRGRYGTRCPDRTAGTPFHPIHPFAVLVVRPPDYFPPAAHAALFASAGRVVLADTFAFSRQSTHNRTLIGTSQGPSWLSVPRGRAPVGTPLDRVAVVDDGWARKHLRALRTAYGMAPFTEHLLPEVEALLRGPHASLGALAVATTAWALRRLGATPAVALASALPGAPATLAGVWEAAGGGPLLSLTPDRDATSVPDVRPFVYAEPPRWQVWGETLTPGLSILDVLLTHGPDARRALGIDRVDLKG